MIESVRVGEGETGDDHVDVALAALVSLAAQDAPPAWPEITRENRPWTRWWWPGSGVDPASLTRQLEQFAAAGLGGGASTGVTQLGDFTFSTKTGNGMPTMIQKMFKGEHFKEPVEFCY